MRQHTFSVIVTGRCNTACTYCHYYARRDRRAVAYDISDEQFETYMKFIKLWSEAVPGETRVRFSGGDPMVLGDRLFSLADKAYQMTGTRPFALTAGKALSREWTIRAASSALTHVAVSIENPFSPDPKAPNPHKVVKAMLECRDSGFTLIPGVCVVSGEQFEILYETCEWFYDRLGRIPVIHEINYDAYRPPTEENWAALEKSVWRILETYSRRTALNLFPSVSPELGFGGQDPYVIDLDLENSYELNGRNYADKLADVLRRLEHDNYPRLACKTRSCTWWEFCDNAKWYWFGDRNNRPAVKLQDYCRFKRLLNDVYYRFFVDRNFAGTTASIDLDTPHGAKHPATANGLVQIGTGLGVRSGDVHPEKLLAEHLQ
jgi:hypothetical protein